MLIFTLTCSTCMCVFFGVRLGSQTLQCTRGLSKGCVITISVMPPESCGQVQWKQIHKYLDSPLYNYTLDESKSSVFTLVQKSNAAPYQEGFLLAASNDNESGCNFRSARESPIPIVSSTSRALYLRMGGFWNNTELQQRRFVMNFSMDEIQHGRCLV